MDYHISSRIHHDIYECKLGDESTWDQGYRIIADRLIERDKAFSPYFNQIRKLKKVPKTP